ncbi:MAG: transcriptional repressor [Verrucomicrobia bacterium]|nr:transcriptional repressor [Verrucomicrobiota bacterium]
MSVSAEDTLARCRSAGLRRTKALEELIEALHDSGEPVTLSDLSDSPRLASLCDKATLYRLLHRLTDKGIVRRLGLHERAAYFTLIIPGEHRDYLICTQCGSIASINAPCPVHELEQEIRTTTGFQGLYHELEFFGICPKCA